MLTQEDKEKYLAENEELRALYESYKDEYENDTYGYKSSAAEDPEKWLEWRIKLIKEGW